MSHITTIVTTEINFNYMANATNGFAPTMTHPDQHHVRVIDVDGVVYDHTVSELLSVMKAVARYTSIDTAVDILSGAAPKA